MIKDFDYLISEYTRTNQKQKLKMLSVILNDLLDNITNDYSINYNKLNDIEKLIEICNNRLQKI
jgi:hypothetical protein